MFVVVYGTLKRGYGNNRILQDGNAEFINECIVHNFKLLWSGFPVAQRSEGEKILGEVWDIGNPEEDMKSNLTLSRLDSLEGYNRSSHSGMYVREEVTAITESGPIRAHMYIGHVPFWGERHGLRDCEVIDGAYVWQR